MEPSKVTKYEEFLNDVLKQDLKKLLDQRDAVYQDIAHHLELRNTVNTLQKCHAEKKPLKTKVDLGCNFYCTAKIDDPSRLFVRVGFGFYVEMTPAEALEYVGRRVPALEARAAELSRQAVAVRAKINMVLEGLRELQSAPPPAPPGPGRHR